MMTTTLSSAPLAPLLERLFTAAEAPPSPRLTAALAQIPAEERAEMLASTTRYRELYALARSEYMAVSRETARLLYMLVRASGARSIVEFGTSFGVSTLHLAAGLRDNGGGLVITTEFEPSKCTRAHENFEAGGLADLVELREGDALETLACDLPERIDLVLFDGAKGLYPAVLTLLEERLASGALLLADNADASPEYLERVRSSCVYVSLPFRDDIELSMRVG
jgi:predicted O-methyltransferase YrrM